MLKDAAPGSEAEEAMEAAVLDDSQLEGIEPPETRFTEEYREYLAAQEAAGEVRGPAGDGEAEAVPAGWPSGRRSTPGAPGRRAVPPGIEEETTCPERASGRSP